MARSRNLKPAFFMNEELAACGLEGMLLFAGLWCHADREGRLEDRPARIKAHVFPYHDISVDQYLDILTKHRFILRYSVDGNKYIQIINFNRHQNPHQKEQASTIPAPDLSGAKSGENQTSPGNSGTSPALTLNPLPLTLNPITTLSGKPDHQVPKNGHAYLEQAETILSYLNQKTGSKFRPRDGNKKPTSSLELIAARLKSGATAENCKYVIDRQYQAWGKDTKMREYLRPSTLFRASNFEQYLGATEKHSRPVKVSV